MIPAETAEDVAGQMAVGTEHLSLQVVQTKLDADLIAAIKASDAAAVVALLAQGGDPRRELWNANLEGENFSRARIHHVYQLCRLGALLALNRDDFASAIDLLERALAHPRRKELPQRKMCELYGDLLYTLLAVNREVEAIAMARKLMTGQISGSIAVWPAMETVAEALEDYLGTLVGPPVVVLLSTPSATQLHPFDAPTGSTVPVSRELTDLAWEVSQQLRRRPLKKRRLPEQATPQELVKLLQRRG